MKLASRVLIIGLDGATWTLLHPLIEDGKMPCLKGLIEKGCYGDMLSTLPSVSAPAWTSITTGKNPGKHGIFDFVRVGSNFDQSLCNSSSKMTSEIWDYLDSSIIANVPITYPPRKIKGFMISGMGTPSTKSGFTQPRALKDEILSRIPSYSIDLDLKHYKGRQDDFFQDVREITEQKIRLFWYLFSLKWKFLFFVFTETDRIQHLLWGSERLAGYFTRIDRFLMDVTKKVSEEDITLILLSDHGFQGLEKIIYVNNILEGLGLLEASQFEFEKRFERVRRIKEHLWHLLHQAGLHQVCTDVDATIIRILQRTTFGASNARYDFNPSRTEAAMIGFEGIYLSRKGDSHDQDAKADSRLERIAKSLKEERDPETGVKVFEEVYKRDELYHGPFANWGPDLVVLPSKGYTVHSGTAQRTTGPSDFWKGAHSLYGIFLIYGQDVKEGLKIHDACVYDVAPTVLHISGVPVPDDMDGRVLSEVFEEGSKLDRTISYRRLSEEEMIKRKVNEMKAFGRI